MIIILKKIWNFVIFVLLFIELIMIALIFIPKIFKINPYVVTSSSMEPKFPIGSLVYAKKTDPNRINKGNEITFFMSGTDIVATHQVYEVDKENGLFYTQGINNKDEKGKIIHDAMPVKYEDLIGKTIFCIPYLGYVNRFVTTSPGIYIVVGITLVIISIAFVIELLDKKGKEVKKDGKQKRKEK